MVQFVDYLQIAYNFLNNYKKDNATFKQYKGLLESENILNGCFNPTNQYLKDFSSELMLKTAQNDSIKLDDMILKTTILSNNTVLQSNPSVFIGYDMGEYLSGNELYYQNIELVESRKERQNLKYAYVMYWSIYQNFSQNPKLLERQIEHRIEEFILDSPKIQLISQLNLHNKSNEIVNITIDVPQDTLNMALSLNPYLNRCYSIIITNYLVLSGQSIDRYLKGKLASVSYLTNLIYN